MWGPESKSHAIVFFGLVGLGGGCTSLSLFAPRDPAATHAIPEFTIPDIEPDTAYERFMVIGDMGTGSESQHAVAAAMATRARADGLDFVITVGDNFYPFGVASPDDPQWHSKFLEVYADPALQVPVVASLGNHDHLGSIQAQIDFSAREPRWIMPAAYYVHSRTLTDGTPLDFFVLDTTPIARGKSKAQEQVVWLEQALAHSRAAWKIVIGHHPIFSHGPHGDTREMIEAIEPILSLNGADLYFAGHDHTLEMLKPINSVHYVISGAAGGPDKAYAVDWTDGAFYAATGGGFVMVRVARDELVVEFVRLDAITQYAHVITKERNS